MSVGKQASFFKRKIKITQPRFALNLDQYKSSSYFEVER